MPWQSSIIQADRDCERRIAKFSCKGERIAPLLLGVSRMYSYSSYCH